MLWSLLLFSCQESAEAPRWQDQLAPSGPCWFVQLGDGLSEESTTELHALFDCVNQNGNGT